MLDSIDTILDSMLSWMDGAMAKEMYDFTDKETRKKLGLELLNMIIKERMENNDSTSG